MILAIFPIKTTLLLLEFDRYRYTNTDTDTYISLSVRRIFKPIYRYDTDTGFIPILIQIYDTDITLKNPVRNRVTDTDIPHIHIFYTEPIPISPISHIQPIPGSYRFFLYRYRYWVSVYRLIPGIG